MTHSKSVFKFALRSHFYCNLIFFEIPLFDFRGNPLSVCSRLFFFLRGSFLLTKEKFLSDTMPPKQESEMKEDDVVKWIADHQLSMDQVVKVLILGNSGAGKSFLCNAILGEEIFEHKNQAGSCTAVNTFSGALFGEGSTAVAFIIANIPGLIEADPNNIPRNEAAIQSAFKMLPNSPTSLLFVLKNTNGRPLDEDYQAVKCVMDYVKFDTKSSGIVVNSVDWEELDQKPDEYKTEITSQIRGITGRPTMQVDFIASYPKAKRSNLDCPEMVQLNGQLVTFIKKLQPTKIAPDPKATLVLDKQKLAKQIDEMKQMIAEERKRHEVMIQQEREKWQKMIKDMQEKNEEMARETQRQIQELKNRPPVIIHQGGGGGGCFNAFTATVALADGNHKPMRDAAVGDEVMAIERGSGKPRVAKVLLVDHHKGERVTMLRLALDDEGTNFIDATPDHLLLVAPAGTVIAGSPVDIVAVSSAARMVQLGTVAVGDLVCLFPGHAANSCGVWTPVCWTHRFTAEPVNIYTTLDTVVVGGTAASCYAVSEWIGWVDMLPTKLLDFVWPGATGSAWFESFRKRFDSHIGDRILYGQ
jgi:hypothetical protein